MVLFRLQRKDSQATSETRRARRNTLGLAWSQSTLGTYRSMYRSDIIREEHEGLRKWTEASYGLHVSDLASLYSRSERNQFSEL